VEDTWVEKARRQGLWVPGFMESVAGWFSESFSRLSRVVILTSASFFAPALFMGMISPVIAKIALDNSLRQGRTIGNIYAWGAVGSIAGTFLAGFVLLSALGMRGLLSLTAAMLSGLGLMLGRQPVMHSTALVAALVLLTFSAGPWMWAFQGGSALKLIDGRDEVLFLAESDYQFVRAYRTLHEVEISSHGGAVEIRQVPEAEWQKFQKSPPPGRMRKIRELRSLTLDHLIHGYVWLRMPPTAAGDFNIRDAVFDDRDLHYAYEQVYAVLTARTARHVTDRPLTTASLGAGSYTFPRYLWARYKDSRHDVAEIDPAVTQACVRALKLDVNTMRCADGTPALRIFHTDARNFVEAAVSKGWTYDVIYGDAFNHYSIPFHLTTKEFHDGLRAILKPGGAYLANVIDTYSSARFLAWYAFTLKETFNHVHIVCRRSSIAVATNDGLEHSCESVEFDGVVAELLDQNGAVLATLPADEVYQFRRRRDGLWMYAHDGREVRGHSTRFRGGKAVLFPQADRDGTRRSIEIDGNTITTVEERGRRGRETFVIIASMDPVDLDRFGTREGDPRFLKAIDRRLADLDQSVTYTAREMELMFRRTGARVFRDDFAPVDNLLVPVFTDRD
jgi:hypothetical protein